MGRFPAGQHTCQGPGRPDAAPAPATLLDYFVSECFATTLPWNFL